MRNNMMRRLTMTMTMKRTMTMTAITRMTSETAPDFVDRRDLLLY